MHWLCRLARLGTLLAAAWLGLAVCPATGRDWYVNNQIGDDRRDGSSSELEPGGRGPLRTIGRALQLAQSGDRVVLAATETPYRESVSLVGGRHSGSPLRPFILDGQGAVLDGSRAIVPEDWEAVGRDVFRFRPARLHHQQLFRDGRPLPRVASDLLGLPPRLEPEHWALAGGWIYFRTAEDKIPADDRLSYTALPVGLTLYHVHDVVVQNLVVQGFSLDGINAHDQVRDCVLLDITARGNGRAGIAAAGMSRLDAVGCIVGDNGEAQVLAVEQARLRIGDSELIANTAPATVARDAAQILLDPRANPAR